MSLQRQHFLLSYLKTLGVGPAGVRTHDLRISRPALSQLSVMFSSFSYRVLFQRFFPQNISLLPKIVTEAHANLKKKKTSCNTTLKHYAVMVKYTPLERSSLISSLIC